jgi:hypothetical protein
MSTGDRLSSGMALDHSEAVSGGKRMRQMKFTDEMVDYAPNEKRTASKYDGSQVLTNMTSLKNKLFGA